MPGGDVERAVVQHRGPQFALIFLHDLAGTLNVLVSGDRRLEVTGAGKAIRAKRPQLRQAEQRTVIFGDIAARFAVHVDAETYPPRDNSYPARRDLHPPHLGENAKDAGLRDDQQFAVGIDEQAVLIDRVARYSASPRR